MMQANTMRQRDSIKEHLETGKSITPAKAQAEYGIWRLASVIHILRSKEGMPIETKNCRSMSGKPYAEYRMLYPALAQ